MPRFAPDAHDDLDPEDPAAVEDALNYLRKQGIECTREEVHELLRKLKEGLLRKLHDEEWGAEDH